MSVLVRATILGALALQTIKRSDGWLYGLKGLIVVYTYFQVPLMVIVFTPALEGLRAFCRSAASWAVYGFVRRDPAVFGGRRLSRPNRPNRLVRNNDRGELSLGQPGQPAGLVP